MPEKTASPVVEQDSLESILDEANEAISDGESEAGMTTPPEYELRVSRDKITLRLDCTDPHSQISTIVAKILADFKELEIPEYPDEEMLTSILTDSCSAGEHLRDYAIMMGIEPVPTIPGRLDWAREFFAEGWQMDEFTGAIDTSANIDSIRRTESGFTIDILSNGRAKTSLCSQFRFHAATLTF